MKNLFKPLMIASFVAMSSLFSSCSDGDNTIYDGPDPTTTNELTVDSAKRHELEITAPANSSVKVNVTFKNAEKDMYRLYITKNEYGSDEGAVKYILPNSDTKNDGSFDLSADQKVSFTLNLDFDTPKTADGDGVVEYKLWVTGGGTFDSARGDYRDIGKNNAYGDGVFAYGTIKITAGSGAAAIGEYKEFSGKLLAAPLADGSSESFMSVYDGQSYRIDQGKEFSAFWDFGYYYGTTNEASFFSTSTFPKNVVDIKTITGTSVLNNFYIEKSTLDFDTANLDDVVKPTTQSVTKLAVGDVLSFVDAYGNKGLIKITNIVPGYGSNGEIEFDVKVQNNEPIKP